MAARTYTFKTLSVTNALYARLKAISVTEQRPITTVIARALDAYEAGESK